MEISCSGVGPPNNTPTLTGSLAAKSCEHQG
jgi:hypothetical protein